MQAFSVQVTTDLLVDILHISDAYKGAWIYDAACDPRGFIKLYITSPDAPTTPEGGIIEDMTTQIVDTQLDHLRAVTDVKSALVRAAELMGLTLVKKEQCAPTCNRACEPSGSCKDCDERYRCIDYIKTISEKPPREIRGRKGRFHICNDHISNQTFMNAVLSKITILPRFEVGESETVYYGCSYLFDEISEGGMYLDYDVYVDATQGYAVTAEKRG